MAGLRPTRIAPAGFQLKIDDSRVSNLHGSEHKCYNKNIKYGIQSRLDIIVSKGIQANICLRGVSGKLQELLVSKICGLCIGTNLFTIYFYYGPYSHGST